MLKCILSGPVPSLWCYKILNEFSAGDALGSYLGSHCGIASGPSGLVRRWEVAYFLLVPKWHEGYWKSWLVMYYHIGVAKEPCGISWLWCYHDMNFVIHIFQMNKMPHSESVEKLSLKTSPSDSTMSWLTSYHIMWPPAVHVYTCSICLLSEAPVCVCVSVCVCVCMSIWEEWEIVDEGWIWSYNVREDHKYNTRKLGVMT